MKLWKSCSLLYISCDLAGEHPCEVRIGDGSIAVSYKDAGGSHVLYEGNEVGDGHYVLSTNETPPSKGTLHKVPDLPQLEGSWVERGETGFWKIELGD